jgi:adenine-specific DNA-methyltransferase
MASSKSKWRTGSSASADSLESVDRYSHEYVKRPYNPPVGLVTPETDKEMAKRTYKYDPHLDP